MSERIYSLAEAASLDDVAQVALLGGKGAALAHMTALGLPVPPGFTLTTAFGKEVLTDGWTDAIDAVIARGLEGLEATLDRRFGDADRPLLVSVRSGAAVSMPGMLATVLNVGMNDTVAAALSRATGDARFGWDTARRFIQSYATDVLGASRGLLAELCREHFGVDDGRSLDPDALAAASRSLWGALADAGHEIPEDPVAQIRAAIGAAFASWDSDRARVYREVEDIDAGLGTAVTVQVMCFGNLGDRSGSGVVFSRDPSTGAPGIVGDFLVGAQGEEVVAGTHATEPISALADRWPELGAQLDVMVGRLERDLADLVDVEFTVEDGTLWLLQVRRGMRSPEAELRLAIDMVDDPAFPLDRLTALERVAAVMEAPPTIATAAGESTEVLARGLAAAPGRASGAICTDVEEAVAAGANGDAIILFRRDTSPSDIAGLAAAKGIVTSLGGIVSHAAVVARGWGVPAVVGVQAIDVGADGITIGARLIPNGTVVTIDGAAGTVRLGAQQSLDSGTATGVEVPEAAVIRGWGRGPDLEAVDRIDVERVLGIKGMGDAPAVAGALGAATGDVAAVLAELVETGEARQLTQGRVRLLPEAMARVDARFAADGARLASAMNPLLERFRPLNDACKQVVTAWQLRDARGGPVPNDHTDAAYDRAVIGRLRTEIHHEIMPLLAEVAALEPRLARYGDRLARALAALEAGDLAMFAHPLRDSYHTVWFELHEELIRLSGRNRADEAAAGRA
ncbi:MAG: PEP/pyruvate-binding domain-containing protein [Acidimicrobiales bacterium]